MESFTMPLDSLTGKFMSLYLFTDVQNTPEIRKKLMSGEMQCSVIKASLVVDPFHVAVAANKAALREHHRQLTTKSVLTEILFIMSCSSNISLSLTKFGIHDNDKNILVVTIHANEDEKKVLEGQILRHIQGQILPLSKILDFTDESLVKKTYKIDEEELKVSNLLYSVASRIGGDYSVSLK